MAKAKKTPAYVKKAIEWLEKNAPDGEQIAFINDQEAAHLKSMGGSGEEVVDGVKSYQGESDSGGIDVSFGLGGGDLAADVAAAQAGASQGFFSGDVGGFPGGGFGGAFNEAEVRRNQEDELNRKFLSDLRRRTEAGEFDEVGRTPDEEAAFTLEGGAEAQRQALEKSNILDIPTRPDAPTLQTPTLTAERDQLVDPSGLGVRRLVQERPRAEQAAELKRVEEASVRARNIKTTAQQTAQEQFGNNPERLAEELEFLKLHPYGRVPESYIRMHPRLTSSPHPSPELLKDYRAGGTRLQEWHAELKRRREEGLQKQYTNEMRGLEFGNRRSERSRGPAVGPGYAPLPGTRPPTDGYFGDRQRPEVIPATEIVDPTGLSPDTPTRVDAATMQAAQVADTGQAQAATQATPTQIIEDIQEAIPTEELAQAATGELDERATVKFQLGQVTSSIKDGEPLPSWAAPAARSADSLMLQRGLGASSMAASARTQALIEAGLPIASSDAQAYGRIQLQNLNNKQQAALQNANNLAAMRTQNLNARMTAAVNNARNFLTIDTTNLNNKQASNTLTFQANQQKLFSNQAAENAARQFNATSENQVEQFFSTLENSVSQANANRLTAIRQFNAGETNAFNQFITNQNLAREQFNSSQQASIRAANANWYRSIATINNGNQMAANSFAAQATLGLREREYNQLWQKRRDDASYIFSSTEAGLDRIAAEAALAQQAAIARGNQKASKSGGLFGALGAIAGGFLKSDIRLKTNIEKIGEINSTVNLYRWEWNEVAEKMGVDNQPSVGVLAQELIEYRPDLVMMYEDGYFRVNYSGLLS